MYCRVPHFVVEICLSLAPTSIIAEYPSGKLPTYMPSEPHGEGDIAVELWKKLELGENVVGRSS